jgi:hypothetical protein
MAQDPTDRDSTLAFIAADLNRVPATAGRTARHAAPVAQFNAAVRAAADAVLTLDATPLSFEAFKAECAEKGRQP